MSVVVAYANTESDPADATWLHEATLAMAAVGPDAQRCRTTGMAGLGHAALHTSLDEPSPQPLTLDGAVWLTADVRLDDRDTLVRAIRGTGRHVPAVADDARLVLDAYLAWGERCVERLAGDFAFVVWDARVSRLFAARDQVGVVPLFYATRGARLVVANALDALRPRVSDALDERAVGGFLVAGHTLDVTTTCYADVRQLAPAHVLTWCDGRVHVRRYWEPAAWTGFERLATPADYVARFRDLLRDAVADRARAPHVGVQLSGGLDSTSVAALAADVSVRRGGAPTIRAYTASAAGVMRDREAEYARLVAEQLGVEIDVVDIDACADVDPLATPEFGTPQPTHFRRTSLEGETVRRPAAHGRAVLTGLGGDVLLDFTRSYWLDWLLRGEVRRVAGVVGEHVRLFGRPPVIGFRSGLRHAARRRWAAGIPLAPWIDGEFAGRTRLGARWLAAQREVMDQSGPVGLARGSFWSELLASGHPGFTGARVRFSHPFFDLRLLRFVAGLPPYPWLVRKHVLREATRGLLPEAVRQRPKAPLVALPNAALRERRGEQARLVAMIDAAPELDRFVDRGRLAAAARDAHLAEPRFARPLVAALGLAYWLQHRRRPVRTSAARHRSAPTAVGAGAVLTP